MFVPKIESIKAGVFRKILIIIFTGFILFADAQSSHIKFKNFSVSNGLSQSTAFSITQDCYGFIWIGTYDGLNRYNGYEIEIYKNNTDSLSLPDNIVQALCTDNEETLWIGTNSKGLYRFDYSNEHFIPFEVSPDTIGYSILTLKNFNDSILVILSEKGISLVNTRTHAYKRISLTAYKQLSDSPSLISYFNPEEKKGYKITCLMYDSQGDLWQGTNAGLLRRNGNTSYTYQHEGCNLNSISTDKITCLFEDRGGVVWIGTSLGGVSLWDRTNEGISLYRKSPVESDGLKSDKIRCFYEDTENRIFIGTVDNGIALWDRESDTFKNFDKSNSPSLNHSHIRDIVKWENQYIVASDGGGIQSFFPDNNYFEDIYVEGLPLDASVWDLFVDDTSLWIASYSHGLFNVCKGRTKKYAGELDGINATWVTGDERGDIWVGSFGKGIFRIHKNRVRNWNKYESNLSDNRIYSIVPDNYNIWIASKRGLNKLDISTGKISFYSEFDGLPNNTIMGIICDSDSSLWLTTNYGISHFYPDSKKAINYQANDGLQNNEFLVHSFLKLHSGEMLLGGIEGFNVFPVNLPPPNSYKPEVAITGFKLAVGDLVTDSSIYTKTTIDIAYYQNEFGVEFAALSFAEPNKNTYRYFLEGFDKQWKESRNRHFVQYTNVPPGEYTFKVKAANNDGIWNDNPTELQINISPAFWQTIVFRLLSFFLVLFLILIIVHLRIRSVHKENAILEAKVRERTREIETALKKLKVAQNQLIHSEKMASIGVLTAGIAHEINNPVNFVSAGVNSVIRDFDDIVPVLNRIDNLKELSENTLKDISALKEEREFDIALDAIMNTLPDIKSGAERITEIVSGLSKFSRLEEENWKKTNLTDEIESVLLLLKNKYKNTIRIEKNYSETPCIIDCFPGKINQVIMNVINNAIDASNKEGAVIKIATRRVKDIAVVVVEDNGSGMDVDVQNKIFDPFFTTKPVGDGLGLGLSISYTIVQEHRGKIKVSSEKNKGTVFIIELPISQK